VGTRQLNMVCRTLSSCGLVVGFLGAGTAKTYAATVPIPPETAEPTEVEISSIDVITSPSGESRILLKPGDLSRFRAELVLNAVLEIRLSGIAPIEPLDVRIEPLTHDWTDGTATWTSPWIAPGGDVDAAYGLTARIEKDLTGQVLYADVSEILRGWADSELTEDGFLLSVPPVKGLGFDSEEMSVLGESLLVKLIVDYRKITGLGIEGGSAFLRRRDRES